MNVTAALEAIYAVQKQLDEDAHHSLKEYVENTHRHVHEMETTYGFTLHYGERLGGYESLPEPPSSPQSSKKEGVLIETS